MRITSSSSLFLATLASSGSLSALAAPTDSGGDFGANSIATLAGPVLGGVPGAPPAGSGQTNTERRGISARDLPDVEALLEGLGLAGLTDSLGVKGVLGAIGLAGPPDAAATAESLFALGPDKIKDAVAKAVGGLPVPVPLPGTAAPSNAHAAFALNAAPTSSTMSEDPASPDYPYEVYPSSYSSGYATEAALTPPGPPGPPIPFSALPLSPPLPANPPNTPVPPPQGAPGSTPSAAGGPPPSSTAAYNGTASASPPSATASA